MLAARLSESGEDVRILTRKPAGPNAVGGEITGTLRRACAGRARDGAPRSSSTSPPPRSSRGAHAARSRNASGRTSTDARAHRCHRDACAGAFLIFVSSASVYAQSGEPLRETALRANDSLRPHQARREELVLDAQRSGRIRACILRPAMIFDRGAEGIARLASLARRGWIVRLGTSPARKSLLQVDTAVDAILAVAEQPQKSRAGRCSIHPAGHR
jgi:nucleoside-diphosphate-sugar epimerase